METWHLGWVVWWWPQPVTGLKTSITVRGRPTIAETLPVPDPWMIHLQAPRHLSYWLQNVTSTLWVLFLTDLPVSQTRNETQTKLLSRNWVVDLKYGTRVRIKTVLYLSANEDYDAGFLTKKLKFSHNHREISGVWGRPWLTSHNWPELKIERKIFSLCNAMLIDVSALEYEVRFYFWVSISYKSFKPQARIKMWLGS